MEKIWYQSYEPGIRHEVDVRAYPSIPAVFDQTVAKYGQREGFTSMGVSYTYAQTARHVEAFASYLQNVLKLERGSRVALMMPNMHQYPVAVFGTLKAGMVIANVNPLYTPRELGHQLKDAGATTIVVLENFANSLELILARTPVKNVIVATIGDMLGTLKGAIVNFVVRKVKKMVPNYHLPHAVSFKDVLKQGAAHTFNPVPLSLEDTAFLQYTGGTTGVAKGAVLTHGNIVANMIQAAEWISAHINADTQEVGVTALPLYHIFSLTVNLMIFTEIGAKNILIANPRDIPGFVKEMQKYPVSVLTGVNTLFNALVHDENFKNLDFSTWKLALGGGMAVQRVVAEKWEKLTGIPLVEGYGLTETSPIVTVNNLSIKEYSGGIGLPVPNTDVQVRNDAGQEVPLGEPGELYVKGPQVMQGYWQRPDETAKVLGADGFLATGDIVVMEPSGLLKIVDRKKDMIVVSGFNVYPNEVEDVIAAIPGVREVACVGVPSDKTGEALKVFVVKSDPNLSKEAIIAHCRKELTAYKVPKDIEFRDDLPKTNVGKILRRALKDESADA